MDVYCLFFIYISFYTLFLVYYFQKFEIRMDFIRLTLFHILTIYLTCLVLRYHGSSRDYHWTSYRSKKRNGVLELIRRDKFSLSPDFLVQLLHIRQSKPRKILSGNKGLFKVQIQLKLALVTNIARLHK